MPGEPTRAFSTLDIPHILFLELARAYARGEERDGYSMGSGYEVYELDPEKVGFAGAIGFRYHHKGEHPCSLVLWSNPPPTGWSEDYFGEELLKVSSYNGETGTWAYGQGNHLREVVGFNLHPYVKAASPSCVLAGMIIVRAGQLSRNSNCATKQFWDGQGEEP